MGNEYVVPTPDWVILGVGGGPNGSVAVYASRRLRTADLDVDYPEPEYDPFGGVWRQSNDPTITISASCAEVVIAFGADYQAALADLFKQWQPAPVQVPQPALPVSTHARTLERCPSRSEAAWNNRDGH